MKPAQALSSGKPIILLASGEPLLHRDWLDRARQQLSDEGVLDIQNLTADAGLDWDELINEGQMMSMFSERKARIIHLPTGKPGTRGAKAIQTLSDNPPEDVLFILVLPLLDKQTKNSAWCKAAVSKGLLVELDNARSIIQSGN